MRKKIFLAGLLLSALMAMTAYADATFSQFWKQDGAGNWYVEQPGKGKVTNAWLCDDAVASNGKDVWYLLDASGNMVTAGLVQDGTGNFYSLETEHNGYYGMLRYKSGSYGGINLSLEGSHNGAFAAVLNTDGIEALKGRYGVTSVAHINNGNCVYTSSFSGSATSGGVSASSGGSGVTGSVVLSAGAGRMDNYPGTFVITQTVNTGWEEYRSPFGGSSSYMFKHNGTPIKGWVCVDGIWWYSPTAQIETPVDQAYAREKAGASGGSSSQGSASGDIWEGWPMADEVDEKLCAEYFVDYLNEYRASLGIAELEVVYEQMDYAQERADRNSLSHEGNTAAGEILTGVIISTSDIENASSVESALAKKAFQNFKSSSSHNKIMKAEKYTKVGAAFYIEGSSKSGYLSGACCEANFER